MDINAIEGLMDYGFSLAARIKEVTAETSPGGKKVTFPEIIGSLNLVFKIPTEIAEAAEGYQEWLLIDDEEAAALKAKFIAKFSIPSHKAELAFEEVWAILLHVGNLIGILAAPEEA